MFPALIGAAASMLGGGGGGAMPGSAPPPSSSAQSGATGAPQTASSGNVAGSFYAERGVGGGISLGGGFPWALLIVAVLLIVALWFFVRRKRG